MFLGMTFFGGKHTLLPSPTNNLIESVSLHNGKFDHLYMSTDATKTVDNLKDDWDYTTRLNASFEKDLEAGSIGFSTRNTDTIVIQTREKDSFEWKTIYTRPIVEDSDFNFIESYPYSRNRSVNEYKLISQINGIENSYVIIECKTEFEGFFIVDKDNIYGTIFNTDFTDTVQNINNTTLELLNNKYPSVYSNSDVNYTSGTTSGCFLKFYPDSSDVDVNGGVKYRNDVMQWLCNGKYKILKLNDGRIFLIKIVGKPTDTNEGHQDLRRISFEWIESGDVNDPRTLYINNLSEVEEAYW